MSDIRIVPMESVADMDGKGYVHWKSWQESYAGIVSADYLANMSLEKCIEIARRWPEGILVAKDGERVIGFVAYGTEAMEDIRPCGMIFGLYLLQEYHGRGIGKRLMEAAMSKMDDCEAVALWVFRENEKAIRFYERCGFLADGEEKTAVYGKPCQVIRMTYLRDFPQRLASRTAYSSEWVELHLDQVRMPSGMVIDPYHRIHIPHESVSVVIVNSRKEYLLIRSKRYMTHRMEWEAPAGRIEYGELPEDAAKREVQEETGCIVSSLKRLCVTNPANGMSDLKMHVFLAHVEVESGVGNADEVSDQRWMSETEVRDMLAEGKIRCGVSMTSLMYAMLFGEKE